MRMKRTWLMVWFISMGLVYQAVAAQKAPPAPSAESKCQVCGMFVAKYPDWTGVIVYKDATPVYFDGPKDLFTYYLDSGKYDPARKRSDIAALYVKDYYSLNFIDGRKAFYVFGSDVNGPMGRELVPFAKKADAEGFLHDHKGMKILRIGEITAAMLKTLD